jgi:transposase
MTIGVDLAKNVFEIVENTGRSIPTSRRRLSRSQFEHFLAHHSPAHVVMEACGTSHHWARVAQRYGHRVSLLPTQRVRPYVTHHRKTDYTDAAALLEAVRNPRIHPVPPKTVAQQELLTLHRLRTHWMTTRTARINMLRGFLQEFGIPIARGARTACTTAAHVLADSTVPVPARLRVVLPLLLVEIRELETRIAAIEHALAQVATDDVVVQRLHRIPGIGLLTATALVATVGHIHAFRDGRHFASWIGLTPRERSSGQRRRLGQISKAGDVYLRSLLTHGARSCLVAARQATRRQRPVTRLQRWSLDVQQRCGHNKAAIAMANKLARIAWVVWAREVEFSADPPTRAAA